MNLNWFYLAAAGGLFSSLFNFINRYVLKTNGDSSSYAWWFEFFRTLIFFSFVIIFYPNFGSNFDFSHSYLLILLGLAEFFTIYSFMKMHAFSDLSISTIVVQLRTVWTPIIAIFLLKEYLDVKEYLGIAIVFLGQMFIFTPKNMRQDKSVRYSFIASFTTSITTVLVKAATSFYPIPIVLISMGLPTILGYPLFMNNGLKRIMSFGKKVGSRIFLTSVLNSVSMYLVSLALISEATGKVAAVFQAMSFSTVLIGIFILNEKTNMWQKILGSFIVIFGVFLLI